MNRLGRVAIVLSEVSLERLRELLKTSHVWLAELAGNAEVAREYLAKEDQRAHSGDLSTFSPIGSTPYEQTRAALELVDDHHNDFSAECAWDVLELVGVPMDDRLEELLVEYGARAYQSLGEVILAERGAGRSDRGGPLE